MKVVIETPTRAHLLGFDGMKKQLVKALTYTDKRVEFELRKAQQSIRRFDKDHVRSKLLDSWGQEKYDAIMTDLREREIRLKAERKKCLLEETDGGLYVPSGMAQRIAQASGVTAERAYHLPPRSTPDWHAPPRYPNRYYQDEAGRALMAASAMGPAGIELPTGSGKSSIIRDLVRYTGKDALVMAPSVSIATQLRADLARVFGDADVGMYGGGKHQYDRWIVVGIDDSLTKVKPDTDEWKALASRNSFIVDESHLTPANSLQKVCHGLAAAIPYRFFVSATQLRNDGLDMVLEGITGPIVYRKTARELIDEGYLAKPTFKMVRVRSTSKFTSPDANRMTRAHLYYNKIVNRVAADLANQFVSVMRRPTLILVEELEQFRELLPLLKHPVRFAHGPLNRETKLVVPTEYQSKDNGALVDAFNHGEFPILVGTSCVSTGTDIQVAEAGIYLQGQRSEIKVRQAIGRETRGGFAGVVRNPWTGALKLDCIHVDFDVVDPHAPPEKAEDFVTHRHADARAEIYTDVYRAPDLIDYTHLL